MQLPIMRLILCKRSNYLDMTIRFWIRWRRSSVFQWPSWIFICFWWNMVAVLLTRFNFWWRMVETLTKAISKASATDSHVWKSAHAKAKLENSKRLQMPMPLGETLNSTGSNQFLTFHRANLMNWTLNTHAFSLQMQYFQGLMWCSKSFWVCYRIYTRWYRIYTRWLVGWLKMPKEIAVGKTIIKNTNDS